MDPNLHHGHLRHEQLLAEAAAHRAGREFGRRTRRPRLALRLYARVWWATRPRVDTWPRGALEF